MYTMYHVWYVGGAIGEVSVEWYARVVQSNATKDQDYIADGAVMVFDQGVNRRGKQHNSLLRYLFGCKILP